VLVVAVGLTKRQPLLVMGAVGTWIAGRRFQDALVAIEPERFYGNVRAPNARSDIDQTSLEPRHHSPCDAFHG
jgi:hypothetical protein